LECEVAPTGSAGHCGAEVACFTQGGFMIDVAVITKFGEWVKNVGAGVPARAGPS